MSGPARAPGATPEELAALAAAAHAALVPAVAPRQFARTPGNIRRNQFLDYSTKQGQQTFKDNSLELPTKFDGSPENLKIFIKHLQDRAEKAGWNDIITIPVGPAGARVDMNLLTQYGRVSLQDVRAHSATWAGVADQRNDQNSAMMYQCISASLSNNAQIKVLNVENEYIVNNVRDGPMFFRVLIGKCYVDTTGTIEQLQQSLRNLPSFMTSVNSNISEFNQHVEDIVMSLMARDAATAGLLTDLYDGYQTASDTKFTRYIETRYEAYMDGRDNMTYQQLMSAAEAMYLNKKRAGEWNAPTAEEEQIIAMTAQIKSLRADQKKPLKKKEKETTKDKDRIKFETQPWMLVPPSANETSKVKKYNKKDWRWCVKHQKWTLHGKPGNECRLTDEQAARNLEEAQTRSGNLGLTAIEDGDDSTTGGYESNGSD